MMMIYHIVILKCKKVVLIDTTAWLGKKPLSKCWAQKKGIAGGGIRGVWWTLPDCTQEHFQSYHF